LTSHPTNYPDGVDEKEVSNLIDQTVFSLFMAIGMEEAARLRRLEAETWRSWCEGPRSNQRP
jgi:hypothetical protein